MAYRRHRILEPCHIRFYLFFTSLRIEITNNFPDCVIVMERNDALHQPIDVMTHEAAS